MTLRVVPDHTVSFLDAPLPPGGSAQVTSRLYRLFPRQLRVTSARVVAEFPRSWLARLARRIPGVRCLFAGRDAQARDRASAQMKIDYVAVGNYQCAPDELDQLPIAMEGEEIVAVVINTGDRPLVAHVFVEGILS